ncbi:MAG: TIGR03905 family TSCPD domain-containing protein [Bacteroidales bacterium]|nr:TIGR03905 family TSCPD domain-containing protein [Bacteroidales bacterium]MBQ2912400.1 TIGR03905 family TSCPD domain-containing protein [Bacteroidales bacterium]MBQ7018272.1 TIGR03905 family TSCPD domain-containing protein [Bacteroidales bacterium]
MKVYEYVPQGVCSRLIHVEINENNEIAEAYFVAGCSGNTQGVCSLAKGMKVEEVIGRLKGIRCGNKSTSCPDQLAKMLEEIEK